MNFIRKTAYLKKDRQERFNRKRGWFVNAWRIVDEDGRDLFQPWCRTKGEARAVAKAHGITLVDIPSTTTPKEN